MAIARAMETPVPKQIVTTEHWRKSQKWAESQYAWFENHFIVVYKTVQSITGSTSAMVKTVYSIKGCIDGFLAKHASR